MRFVNLRENYFPFRKHRAANMVLALLQTWQFIIIKYG
jgi:hypothetical protein